MKFNPDTLTLNECELIEEHSGKDIEDIVSMNVLSAKTAKVLVWIIRRRENPALKLEECGDMTLSELTAFLGGDDNPKDKTE